MSRKKRKRWKKRKQKNKRTKEQDEAKCMNRRHDATYLY